MTTPLKEWIWRPQPVARIIELLQHLEPTDTVTCNDIGHLSIDRNGVYLGFIDFGGNGGIVPYLDRIEADIPDAYQVAEEVIVKRQFVEIDGSRYEINGIDPETAQSPRVGNWQVFVGGRTLYDGPADVVVKDEPPDTIFVLTPKGDVPF